MDANTSIVSIQVKLDAGYHFTYKSGKVVYLTVYRTAGTLLDENATVTAATADALRAAMARGVQVIIATGKVLFVKPLFPRSAIEHFILSFYFCLKGIKRCKLS